MGFMAPQAKSPFFPSTQAASEAMARYADGDAAAFAVPHDEIAPRIEGFVRRRTLDASRIDDIVQQTFERIHRARGTFIRGSDVLSWAFKIARNLCLDFGAKGWREQTVDGQEGHDPLAVAVAEIADAERVAMARETLARLGQAIRSLPPKQPRWFSRRSRRRRRSFFGGTGSATFTSSRAPGRRARDTAVSR